MLTKELSQLIVCLADDLDQKVVPAGDEENVGHLVSIVEVEGRLLRIVAGADIETDHSKGVVSQGHRICDANNSQHSRSNELPDTISHGTFGYSQILGDRSKWSAAIGLQYADDLEIDLVNVGC